MSVRVHIPAPLRSYVAGRDAVELEARTVREAIERLVGEYGGLKAHLLAEDGKLRSFVNLYVNERDIRDLDREATELKDGDEISIVPSVAGGAIGVETVPELSHQEILRYSRHLILPEVGPEGQRRLKGSRVLLVGAGGLGSPAALYLAAAGVGTIGLVDFDAVDATNLQRQILHGTRYLGRSKLESAKDRLTDLNPHVHVECFPVRLTSENALEILRDFEVILDGSDNFPTRYLVNDACVLLGKPNSYGAIFRFEGQASVFYAAAGPCYRCLYPEPPPPGLVPSCAEGGVLGVLPGIIGSIQALEAIKLVLGKGETLIGRLLLFDALKMRFRELKLRKDPACPICGEQRTIHELIDYEAFCGIAQESAVQASEITPAELEEALASGSSPILLDVREPFEWEICHLEGAKLIPLRELPGRLGELDGHREIVTYCHHGQRSMRALEILKAAGFSKVRSLKGGIDAWAREVAPEMTRY
ncbi:putative adenylyltransferase/sulfurtransferase MoeZ [bacterium HR33]|nr:putative adenylyltransferase/sulfurtransferase MoeZ [bacterium HR33]